MRKFTANLENYMCSDKNMVTVLCSLPTTVLTLSFLEIFQMVSAAPPRMVFKFFVDSERRTQNMVGVPLGSVVISNLENRLQKFLGFCRRAIHFVLHLS